MKIWFTSSMWSFTDEQTHLLIHSTWNKPYHIHFSIRNVHQKYLHEGNRNSKLSEYRSRKFHQKGLTVVSLVTRYYYAMQSGYTILFSAKKLYYAERVIDFPQVKSMTKASTESYFFQMHSETLVLYYDCITTILH